MRVCPSPMDLLDNGWPGSGLVIIVAMLLQQEEEVDRLVREQ